MPSSSKSVAGGDPALREIDLLVVGGRRDSRGVVQSASYGARAFGVKSGMPIAQAARLCPAATFVRGEFTEYRRASEQVRAVLVRFAPLVVMTGLDEGYLDFNGTDLLYPDVAAGSGGSDSPRRVGRSRPGLFHRHRAEPDDRQDGQRFRQTARHLRSPDRMGTRIRGGPAARGHPRRGTEDGGAAAAGHGLIAVHQIQAFSLDQLAARIGRDEALLLKRRADGHGGTVLHAAGAPKSVSRETTFARDVSDPAELDRVLLLLTSRVASQLRAEELVAGAVVLKLRHGDFTTVTRRTTLAEPTALDAELLEPARALLQPAFGAARSRRQGVRLLGIAAVALRPAEAPDLFEPAARTRQRRVAAAVDRVRERFGTGSVASARLIGRPRRADAARGSPGRRD